MDNQNIEQINQENADLICAKINLEADEEVKAILEKSEKEAEKILGGARFEAEEKKQRILKNVDIEIQKSREKILSALNLEKKRLVLGEKDKFIQLVLVEVKKKLAEFRKDKGYPQFLENVILEGLEVIGENNFVIYYSYLDDIIFDDVFMKRVEKICREFKKLDCQVKFNKADFSDLGVIVNSLDGRVMYDNRLLARLGRAQEEIYRRLLKETF